MVMTINRIIKVAGALGVLVLVGMLTLTSPTAIGPLGVLVFFTTLYITIFSVFSTVLQIFYRLAYKKDKTMHRKDYLSAAVLAFGPIMVMIARSFGAVNLWTIVLISLFLTLAEFLVRKKA